MQTEGYRFGNKIVDDWEGNVNSWPLDEGLIDYVDKASYGDTKAENPLYTANIIANKKIRLGAKILDAGKIDKKVIAKLNSALDVEANVGTGYHAIEFLLWGQNLHGTAPGAGERPATDYDLKNCTGGNCDRRRDYLKAATSLLVDDLAEMVKDWKPGGAARKALAKEDDNAAALDHSHRPRLSLVRRTRGRTHEAWRAAARSRRKRTIASPTTPTTATTTTKSA